MTRRERPPPLMARLLGVGDAAAATEKIAVCLTKPKSTCLFRPSPAAGQFQLHKATSTLPQGPPAGGAGQASLLLQASNLPRRREERCWGKVDFAQAASQRFRRTPIGNPVVFEPLAHSKQRST